MEQSDLLKFVIDALERLRIRYAIVGSIATGVWGESRFTQDIDILIELSAEQIQPLCKAFPTSDFYFNEGAARDAVARQGQFYVISPASGNKIDFMIAGRSPWTKSQFDRRKSVQIFPGHNAIVAAPEDVIIGRLVYFHAGGSDKHLRDITSILDISRGLVDYAYVAAHAQ